MTAEVNFVRQQGFRDASPGTCGYQYPALMWQPRLVGVLLLVGLAFQLWQVFLALSALLWWNATLPRLNPFDALYNALVAKPKGLSPLGPAPGPRRFAQAMGGTFMLAVGSSLLMGWKTAGWVMEGLVIIAFVALIFGRFCLGSYLYFVLRGEAGFANRTLPWVRAE